MGDARGRRGRPVAQRRPRPAEAQDWPDKPQRASVTNDVVATDLRIDALKALGRKTEAQAERWRHFERTLSVAHLRAYPKRLPDFEDFDAEQKALNLAGAHPDAVRALAFLIEWRDLDRTDRLVRERAADLDGRLYEVLRPAAEALDTSRRPRAFFTGAWSRACWIAAPRSNIPTPPAISKPAAISPRACRRLARSKATRISWRGCEIRMVAKMGSGADGAGEPMNRTEVRQESAFAMFTLAYPRRKARLGKQKRLL